MHPVTKSSLLAMRRHSLEDILDKEVDEYVRVAYERVLRSAKEGHTSIRLDVYTDQAADDYVWHILIVGRGLDHYNTILPCYVKSVMRCLKKKFPDCAIYVENGIVISWSF